MDEAVTRGRDGDIDAIKVDLLHRENMSTVITKRRRVEEPADSTELHEPRSTLKTWTLFSLRNRDPGSYE